MERYRPHRPCIHERIARTALAGGGGIVAGRSIAADLIAKGTINFNDLGKAAAATAVTVLLPSLIIDVPRALRRVFELDAKDIRDLDRFFGRKKKD